MDGRQAAPDGDAAARDARQRGLHGRRHDGQRGRGRVEASAPRGVRAAGVSAGRSGAGGFFRGAARPRRQAGQGVDVSDALDALGPRFRMAVHAPRPSEFSRRSRAGVRALRMRSAAHRVRQSQSGRDQDVRGLRAPACDALRGPVVALPFRSVLLPPAHGSRQGWRRVTRQSHSLAAPGADAEWRRH
jgi:hypothetical protein